MYINPRLIDLFEKLFINELLATAASIREHEIRRPLGPITSQCLEVKRHRISMSSSI